MIRPENRWNEKSENEKIRWCLNYALSAMQSFVLNETNTKIVPEYCNMLTSAIDWISVKNGMDPEPLYYGRGRNSAESYFGKFKEIK